MAKNTTSTISTKSTTPNSNVECNRLVYGDWKRSKKELETTLTNILELCKLKRKANISYTLQFNDKKKYFFILFAACSVDVAHVLLGRNPNGSERCNVIKNKPTGKDKQRVEYIESLFKKSFDDSDPFELSWVDMTELHEEKKEIKHKY